MGTKEIIISQALFCFCAISTLRAIAEISEKGSMSEGGSYLAIMCLLNFNDMLTIIIIGASCI